MWETIRGYLTFNRKERLGVLFLLAIICFLFVLPYFFRPRPGEPDPETYEKMKMALQKFESSHPDSSRNADDDKPQVSRKQGLFPHYKMQKSNAQPFFFDPNSLKTEEWQKLGLTDHVAQTIVHFIEKGGRFHKSEDLKKIYGLRADEYERLFPYVRINENPKSAGKTGDNAKDEISVLRHVSKRAENTDINQADSAKWSMLPGIGARLASRIIHFREKLGGFYSVDQVGETFGLPDSTFQKIKPLLLLSSKSLVLVDINYASRESLQSHPYIRWKLAKAIIEYRNQHGHFRSVDELMQLALMDSGKFVILKPYLTVNP